MARPRCDLHQAALTGSTWIADVAPARGETTLRPPPGGAHGKYVDSRRRPPRVARPRCDLRQGALTGSTWPPGGAHRKYVDSRRRPRARRDHVATSARGRHGAQEMSILEHHLRRVLEIVPTHSRRFIPDVASIVLKSLGIELTDRLRCVFFCLTRHKTGNFGAFPRANLLASNGKNYTERNKSTHSPIKRNTK